MAKDVQEALVEVITKYTNLKPGDFLQFASYIHTYIATLTIDFWNYTVQTCVCVKLVACCHAFVHTSCQVWD